MLYSWSYGLAESDSIANLDGSTHPAHGGLFRMRIVFVIGRILFALFFVFAGVQKLMDIAGTSALIATKIALPSDLAVSSGYIEALFGMSTAQFLAIMAGATELAAGILIAFNVAIRAVAIFLILFILAGTYYMHDFWNMAGEARLTNLAHAMINLCIIGALMVFIALGSLPPGEPAEGSVG
jgi:uncharacterized membrane protein YphA (DoxX/SURF4 family)